MHKHCTAARWLLLPCGARALTVRSCMCEDASQSLPLGTLGSHPLCAARSVRSGSVSSLSPSLTADSLQIPPIRAWCALLLPPCRCHLHCHVILLVPLIMIIYYINALTHQNHDTNKLIRKTLKLESHELPLSF